MMSWSDLPPEIRHRVLEFVVSPQRDDFELTEFPLYDGISRYAVVSREWQNFIESVNFRRIMVDEFRLPEFERMFKGSRRGRRKHVSHISLEIALPEHDELDKWTPEKKILEMQNRNSGALTRTVAGLFCLLSGWRLEETRSAGDSDPFGLTLEIVLAGEAPDPPPHPDRIDSEHQDTRLQLSNKFLTKSIRALMDFQPPAAALTGSRGPVALPKLDIVKRLCVPAFGQPSLPPRTLPAIISHLAGLKYLVVERLGDQSDIVARAVDIDLCACLAQLPPTIEAMSLFEEPSQWTPRFNGEPEDEDDDDDVDGEANDMDYEKQPRITTTQLVRRLVEKSQSLSQFSASFWIDALDFLHPFMAGGGWKSKSSKLPYWENLQTLTLTSYYLRKKRKARDVNKLLVGAARAALRMPKLRIMEIYDVRKGRVDGLFRYMATDGTTTITWSSPWDFQPSDKVYKAWTEVAKAYTRHEIQGILTNGPPGPPFFDPVVDRVPLEELKTRTFALYEISAREYAHEWMDAYEANENGEEGDGWETEDSGDDDEDE